MGATPSMIKCYEYLDHTADIQIHSWGETLVDSFVQAAYGLIDYMAERESFEVDPNRTFTITTEGRDLDGLLFNFLDEVLLTIVSEPFFAIKEMNVLAFEAGPKSHISVECRGETFDRQKHKLGTEVKAITFSNMRISQQPPYDIYVVVDI